MRYLDTVGADKTLARQQLEAIFQSWIASGPEIAVLASTHPLLDTVKVRRRQLPELGFLGMQSLALLDSKSTPDQAWLQEKTALLKQVAEPVEVVDFAILPPLQALLDAVQQR